MSFIESLKSGLATVESYANSAANFLAHPQKSASNQEVKTKRTAVAIILGTFSLGGTFLAAHAYLGTKNLLAKHMKNMPQDAQDEANRVRYIDISNVNNANSPNQTGSPWTNTKNGLKSKAEAAAAFEELNKQFAIINNPSSSPEEKNAARLKLNSINITGDTNDWK